MVVICWTQWSSISLEILYLTEGLWQTSSNEIKQDVSNEREYDSGLSNAKREKVGELKCSSSTRAGNFFKSSATVLTLVETPWDQRNFAPPAPHVLPPPPVPLCRLLSPLPSPERQSSRLIRTYQESQFTYPDAAHDPSDIVNLLRHLTSKHRLGSHLVRCQKPTCLLSSLRPSLPAALRRVVVVYFTLCSETPLRVRFS